ncbi:MAG: serine protease, partial [Chlorobi bacterium]|nr:serine protease [Chlorobiota bacterium]
EPGQSTARCSGVLIASDLVLTAAHCFSGPPAMEPKDLEVWFDHAELPTGTMTIQRRRILETPVAPPAARWPDLMAGVFDASLLDYAIVRFDTSAAAAPLPNRPEPQCVRGKPLARGDAIYVVGYPRGERATVHDNARVYLPFRLMDGADFFQLRLDVEADFLGRPDRLDVMKDFQTAVLC